MKNIPTVILSFLLLGCQDKKSDVLQSDQGKEATAKSIVISSLPSIPADIEGCACIFSSDSVQYAAKNYLFAANYDSTAYVNVNGKVQRLKLKSSTRNADDLGDQDRVEEFENDLYSIKIILKYQNHTADEMWSNVGTLILKDQNGNVVREKLFGECGC